MINFNYCYCVRLNFVCGGVDVYVDVDVVASGVVGAFHLPDCLSDAFILKIRSRGYEFLLAIDVTSSGTPEEKLKWAFRMYDVDGNGVIDIQEMTKIVQSRSVSVAEFVDLNRRNPWKSCGIKVEKFLLEECQKRRFFIFLNAAKHNRKLGKAIYDMLGACSSNRPADSAEERAKNIFAKMDENNDGQLTQEEFLKGCLQDEELSKMLAP
ncbi:hypothetical protein RUM44_010031 [Polyplax serrata]|uniref:EF-hand domain-containing protein n=1 Tax=Polyplax serrata TaxID=468196 RepID=A0ABR1AUC8_POLSC